MAQKISQLFPCLYKPFRVNRNESKWEGGDYDEGSEERDP